MLFSSVDFFLLLFSVVCTYFLARQLDFGLIFSDFASFFSLFELIIGAKMVFKVTLGCTVSGRVGPLVYAHPDAKKRTRTLYYSTVVETIPNTMWTVFWHDLQLTAITSQKSWDSSLQGKPTLLIRN